MHFPDCSAGRKTTSELRQRRRHANMGMMSFRESVAICACARVWVQARRRNGFGREGFARLRLGFLRQLWWACGGQLELVCTCIRIRLLKWKLIVFCVGL